MYTINNISIATISAQFIAKINEPGVASLGHVFFQAHDCIHWFTGIGVSIPEERLINEIQKHMLKELLLDQLSEKAKEHVEFLKEQGVWGELSLALVNAKAEFLAQF